MLGMLFPILRKKQDLTETVLLIQEGDLELRNNLLKKYKPFIKKSVSSVCRRYIRETDDEFSIGLIAFNDAIDKFSPDKGNGLLPFADTVIRRRVIDYIRSQSKKMNELSFEIQHVSEDEYIQSPLDIEKSIENHQRQLNSENLKDEIIRYTELLKIFHITFDQLVKHTPKHVDARNNAIKIAKTIADEPLMLQYVIDKKKLPIKMMEEKVEVSRKTIERNRIYIIAMVLILTGDYLFLKDYLKGVLSN
ncbi:RNA polymerase sigma factor SigI [Pradoshia sp. D12]|nr:RNA polymerase sigma-I factor [Bacillus sp. FJAT-27986]QFK70798.1 RNA polymerase sigma factor SigI [Pradoshia sp. D12]TPF72589.1 RNA polymerase sigma factor SigI [Bacillus sp. D12]